MNPCAFTECHRVADTKGLCRGHYLQQWKGQDLRPLYQHLEKTPCEFPGCSRFAGETSLCRSHRRQRRLGQELKPLQGRSSTSYQAVHNRLRRERGDADEFICVSCGKEAETWACQGNRTSTEVRHSGIAVTYSVDVDDYEPMCHPCHRKLDAPRGEDHHRATAILTEDFVVDLKRRAATGETISAAEEARKVGVSACCVSDVLRGRTWRHL